MVADLSGSTPLGERLDPEKLRKALGRTVSVAQRLESTATPDSVHVGEGTYRAGRGSFRFEAAPLITVSGPSDVERTYRAVGRKRGVTHGSEPATKMSSGPEATSA